MTNVNGVCQVVSRSLLTLSRSLLTLSRFVANMDDWMVAADLMVTKAGPGTIAEAVFQVWKET